MEVTLICSDHLRKMLEEILVNRKISIGAQSNVCIIEKGFDLGSGKVGVYFDAESLDVLIDFLDRIAGKHSKQQSVIAGKSDSGEYKIVPFDEILYFEALGKTVYCQTKEAKYTVKEKLYDLETKLNKDGFIRVSKSFIVNLKGIDRIVPWFSSTLILKMTGSATEIVVTRSYLNDFKRFLDI